MNKILGTLGSIFAKTIWDIVQSKNGVICQVLSGIFSLKLSEILFKRKWEKSWVLLVHFRSNQLFLGKAKKILVHISLFTLTLKISFKPKKKYWVHAGLFSLTQKDFSSGQNLFFKKKIENLIFVFKGWFTFFLYSFYL